MAAYYVDHTATGANDGSSPTDAWTTIERAFEGTNNWSTGGSGGPATGDSSIVHIRAGHVETLTGGGAAINIAGSTTYFKPIRYRGDITGTVAGWSAGAKPVITWQDNPAAVYDVSSGNAVQIENMKFVYANTVSAPVNGFTATNASLTFVNCNFGSATEKYRGRFMFSTAAALSLYDCVWDGTTITSGGTLAFYGDGHCRLVRCEVAGAKWVMGSSSSVRQTVFDFEDLTCRDEFGSGGVLYAGSITSKVVFRGRGLKHDFTTFIANAYVQNFHPSSYFECQNFNAPRKGYYLDQMGTVESSETPADLRAGGSDVVLKMTPSNLCGIVHYSDLGYAGNALATRVWTYPGQSGIGRTYTIYMRSSSMFAASVRLEVGYYATADDPIVTWEAVTDGLGGAGSWEALTTGTITPADDGLVYFRAFVTSNDGGGSQYVLVDPLPEIT